MLGAELAEVHPVVPIPEGHALSIGIFTYRDNAFFGLYADPEALPDVQRLPSALNASILGLARATNSGADRAGGGGPTAEFRPRRNSGQGPRTGPARHGKRAVAAP
jgi:hypothetical protein